MISTFLFERDSLLYRKLPLQAVGRDSKCTFVMSTRAGIVAGDSTLLSRLKFMDLLLNWIRERYCKFIICPIDSKIFFDLKAQECPTTGLFKYPYEAGAFKVVASVQRMNKSKKNNKGKTIVIFDEQHGHDGNFLSLFEGDLSFSDDFTGYQPKPRARNQPERFDQIVDVPHFSKSHLAPMIQLADVCAFVVNRYLQITVYNSHERFDGELQQISDWYHLIGDNIVAHGSFDPNGRDGLCGYYRALRPARWSGREWVVRQP